ncbi:MAG: DUF4304 domain-containing protein [Myxococcales bacterium]|nr:DUF4304 domain-containing protein [Myxococcales bacterium]
MAAAMARCFLRAKHGGVFGISKKRDRLPRRFSKPKSDREIEEKVVRQAENVTTAEFKKIVRQHLSPQLRELGFTGSGFDYRRTTQSHYVHTIQLFASKYGGECWVEAGIFIDAFPNESDHDIMPRKVRVLDCQIRKNLYLENGNSNIDYGRTEEEAIEAAKLIVAMIQTEGTRLGRINLCF